MSTNREANMKAKLNGDMAEQMAYEILQKFYNIGDIEMVNTMIDIIAKKEFIEVKSCQMEIGDKTQKKGWRNGCFIMPPEQREYLEVDNGLYLFIVHSPCGKLRMKLVPVLKVPKQRSIAWTKIFGR